MLAKDILKEIEKRQNGNIARFAVPFKGEN